MDLWIIYLPGVLGLLLSWFIAPAHGLECQLAQHTNGSASYIISGGQSSGDCLFEWTKNGTVIAFRDETGQNKSEEVLAQHVNGIILEKCQTGVQYREECPEGGVSNTKACPSNCSSRDGGQPEDNVKETHSPVESFIVPVVLAIIGFIIFIIIYCHRKKIFGACRKSHSV